MYGLALPPYFHTSPLCKVKVYKRITFSNNDRLIAVFLCENLQIGCEYPCAGVLNDSSGKDEAESHSRQREIDVFL